MQSQRVWASYFCALVEIALPAGVEIGNDLSYTRSTRGRWGVAYGWKLVSSVYLFSSLEIMTFEMVGIWLVGAFTVLSIDKYDAGKKWYILLVKF